MKKLLFIFILLIAFSISGQGEDRTIYCVSEAPAVRIGNTLPELIRIGEARRFSTSGFTNGKINYNGCGEDLPAFSGTGKIFQVILTEPTDIRITLKSNDLPEVFVGLMGAYDLVTGNADACLAFDYNLEGESVEIFLLNRIGEYYLLCDWTDEEKPSRENFLELSVKGSPACPFAVPLSINTTLNDNNCWEGNYFTAITYQEHVNKVGQYEGPEKIYRVRIRTRTTIKASLTNMDQDLDLFLLDECGRNCLAASTRALDANDEKIEKELLPGSYLLVVDAAQENTYGKYTLAIFAGENS